MIKLIFLLLLPFTLLGQHSIIDIDNVVFKECEKSLIVISDNSGEIYFEKVVDGKQDIEDLKLEFIKPDEETKYCLTVYNEYIAKNINIGSHYCRALTIYDFGDYVSVNHDYYFNINQYKKTVRQSLKINITDVFELNDFYFGSKNGSNLQKAKVKKDNLLKMTYEHDIGTDLYCVLRCNNEDYFRYFYIPSNEVKIDTELSWKDLKSDLERKIIELPDYDFSRIRFSTRNELTGNKCFLYDRKKLGLEGEISLYVPKSEFFYNYEFNLSSTLVSQTNVKNRKYQYTGDEFPKIAPNLEIREYPILVEKENGFTLEYLLQPDINFNVSYLFRPPEMFYVENFKDFKISSWNIEGLLDEDVDFTIPNLDYYTTTFESTRNMEGFRFSSCWVNLEVNNTKMSISEMERR